MNIDYDIRKIEKNERDTALSLVWEVFQKYEAPDYSDEGVAEFHKTISDGNFISNLTYYCAFMEDKLIGIIATRSEGTHIALFFVDGAYQGNGIGKALFNAVKNECPSDKITVNSSPYAVPIYHKLGFTDTDTEQVVNGLRFTPMECRI